MSSQEQLIGIPAERAANAAFYMLIAFYSLLVVLSVAGMLLEAWDDTHCATPAIIQNADGFY